MTSSAIRQAIKVLNEALEADREAINALFNVRVPVNDELANHPTIQVWSSEETGIGQCEMRALGLINGLFGVDEKDYGLIGVETDEQWPRDDGELSYHINRFVFLGEEELE